MALLTKSTEQVAQALSQATAAIGLADAYVDETAGSDDTGDGTQAKPYKSVLGAYIARSSVEVSCLVRKAGEGDAPSEWVSASATMVKRSKKGFEGHLKKTAKAGKAAEEAAAKAEEGKKELEASKNIVLEETPGAAKRIKIRQSVENRDTKIRVFGWVHRLRQQKGVTFLVLRDGTGYLQCVLSGKLVSPQLLCFVYLRLTLAFPS